MDTYRMNPNEFAARLRHIASKIDNSKNPMKSLVIDDLKSSLASLHLADDDQITEEQYALFEKNVDQPLDRYHVQDVFETSELNAKHPLKNADIYVTFNTFFLNQFDKGEWAPDDQETQNCLAELFDLKKDGATDFFVLVISGDSDKLLHYDYQGSNLSSDSHGERLPEYDVQDLVDQGAVITNSEFITKAVEHGYRFSKNDFTY